MAVRPWDMSPSKVPAAAEAAASRSRVSAAVPWKP